EAATAGRAQLIRGDICQRPDRAQAAEGDANPFATSRVRSHLRAPFHHYAHPLAQRAGGANAGGAQAQSVTALRALLGCSPSAHEPASAPVWRCVSVVLTPALASTGDASPPCPYTEAGDAI
ncbi:unnamed protein product, partial [Ixodes persulcatus]